MFHSIFSSLLRSKLFSIFSLSFDFTQWSAGTTKSTRLQVIFWLINTKTVFFQATVVSILLYGCTIWTLTKRMEKKLDGNYTRMLQTILNKSWRQRHRKQQLYSHRPPITTTIKVRRTRHAGHCWRSKDKLISDILLWTPSHGRVNAGAPARTYIQQLCADELFFLIKLKPVCPHFDIC